MKKLLLPYFVLILLLPTQAQNWTWAETAGGTLPDEANGCCMDNNGNMYMTGFYFSTSINFGGSSLSNDGLSDGFIVKYNANGSTSWSSRVKGSLEDKTTKCAVDSNGNVFATGYFDSPSIQFGGNNAHNVSNSDGSGGTFDCFIVKYNSSGTPLWFHAIGETDDDGGSCLATDSDGNVYITGWYRAPSITSGSFTLYNENPVGGSSDMFLIKYDPNGNTLWAKNAGSLDDDKGRGCIVDPSGNIIVTGYCKGDSIDIEGSYYPNSGSKDGFVIKYDENGTLISSKVFGGSGGEEPFSCSTDADGNVFLSGNFSSSSVTFDTETITNTGSGSGAFLVKLNPSLTAQWAKGVCSSSDDEARGCATDIYGNTVITGVYNGSSITFGSTVLNNNGGDEIFLAKYDTNGNLFWAIKIGKSNDDGANDCYIDNNGRILIAGYYNSGSLTLGNIDLDNSYIIVATSDVFIATTCNAEIGTDTQIACDTYTWIDGNTYTSSNNSAIFNFPGGSANSCDSLVILDLTINTVDTSVIQNGISLTANTATASYIWMDCDNNYSILPNETAQTFTATINGNYAVEVTENGCVDTSACYNITSVGINEFFSDINVSIYPNPTSGVITIEGDNIIEIELMNINGQIISKIAVKEKQLDIDLSEQAKGSYLIKIITNKGVGVEKIVLE